MSKNQVLFLKNYKEHERKKAIESPFSFKQFLRIAFWVEFNIILTDEQLIQIQKDAIYNE